MSVVRASVCRHPPIFTWGLVRGLRDGWMDGGKRCTMYDAHLSVKRRMPILSSLQNDHHHQLNSPSPCSVARPPRSFSAARRAPSKDGRTFVHVFYHPKSPSSPSPGGTPARIPFPSRRSISSERGRRTHFRSAHGGRRVSRWHHVRHADPLPWTLGSAAPAGGRGAKTRGLARQFNASWTDGPTPKLSPRLGAPRGLFSNMKHQLHCPFASYNPWGH